MMQKNINQYKSLVNAEDQEKNDMRSSADVLTLAKGTLLSFSGEITHTVIIYAFGIVIAQFLGADNFGIFTLGITIYNLIVLFLYCGVEDGLLRFIGLHLQQNETGKVKGVIRFSLISSVGIGVGFGILCYFLSDTIAQTVFHEPRLSLVLRSLCLAVPVFALITVPVATLRGFQRVQPYIFVRKIFFPLMSFLLALFVLMMGYGLRELTVAYIVSICCTALLSLFLFASFLSRLKIQERTTPDWNKYVVFMSSSFFVNLMIFMSNWSDFLILGMFHPARETGIYFAAKRTAMVLSFFLLSVNIIFAPVASHLHSGNAHTQLSRVYKSTARWILMLSLPLFLLLVFFPNEILSLFGSDFREGGFCLVILAFGNFFHVSAGASGHLMMMTGRHRWMVFNAVLFFILAIIFTFLLVPRYGMLGAALANTAAMVLANLILLAEVYSLIQCHPYTFRYLLVIGAGAVTAAAAYLMIHCWSPDTHSFLVSSLQGLFMVVLFFALTVPFGLDDAERQYLFSYKKKIQALLYRKV